MSWDPIASTVPQYHVSGSPANGYFLKFYAEGTTTAISMATDNTGGTTLAKCQLNSQGYPINGSSAVFIPHIDQRYKLALYTNATDADNDTTANAVWVVDGLAPLSFGSAATVGTISDLKGLDVDVYDYAFVSGHTSNSDGGGGLYYFDSTGSASDNNGTVIQPTTGTGRWNLKLDNLLSVKQFGATGDGTTDDATAIQAALDTGKSVYLPEGTYAIGTTLNYAADGQIIAGHGAGNDNEPARTILKWTGATGGTMFTISDGSENYQNCTLRDIYFNGNSKATFAITGYNNSVTGGAWRNTYLNIYIANLTGTSTGLTLGSGSAPDFAHDAVIEGCYFNGCTTGVSGSGAMYQFHNTTFTGCTDAVVAASGSAWTFTNCVFSQSGDYDFEGTNISQATFTGCWFEDSVTGIYYATTGHSVGFFGCYLQTKSTNTTKLMDWGNAAGYAVVKGCVVGSTSGSTLIKNINAALEYDISTTNCTIDSGYRARHQGVTRSDACSFAAGLTNDQSNKTGTGSDYDMTDPWTEIYDRTSVFTASTGTVTAPVFGEYHFDAQVNLQGLTAASNDARLYLTAAGTKHFLCRYNAGNIRDGSNEAVLSGSTNVYLQSGETAYLTAYVAGATAQNVSIGSGNAGVLWRTRFSGFLIS